VGGVSGLDGAYAAAASPDGKNLYVAGIQADSLVVFTRDTTTGALTYSTKFTDGAGGIDGLDGIRSVVVSPDGKNVYATGSVDDALVVFNRDTTTGALTYSTTFKDGVNNVNGLDGADTIAVSADGKSVYVTGGTDDAVAVFTRNTTTGALTYSTINDGANISGLNAAAGIAVSPDGKNVYATGGFDNSLVVFERDTTTGDLSYVDIFQDGIDGVDGLAAAQSVIVSADGKYVYVAGLSDDAIAVFARDTTTGALTYVSMVKDGVDGVDGLDGAYTLALSPDGESLYVASRYDLALAVFTRDTTTGALTYSTMFKNGFDGVDGLDGASSVVVSADGKNVYVASDSSDAVAIFNFTTDFKVNLADAANGLTDSANTVVTDTEGKWSGGTLTLERVTGGGAADGNANDVFSFLPGLTVTGGPIVKGSDATGTISDGTTQFASWAYTSATGKLVMTFDSTATTAQVQSLVRNIGYSNDTPYGDAKIRLTLTDRVATNTATATVTVTSSTIYVDRADDTDSDGDAADGFTLREALVRGAGQAGADTIKVMLADNTTITLSSGVTSGADDTLDLDGANGLTITGSTLTLGGALSISNGTGDTAIISTTIAGPGKALTKTGTGTITLSGTNTYSGTTTVSAGTLLVSGALNATTGVTVADGARLGGTGSIFATSSTRTLTVASGGTLAPGVAGTNSGVGTLTINGHLVLSSGSTLALDIAGATVGTGYDQVVVKGTVTVTGANLSVALSYTPASGDKFRLISNDNTDAISGAFTGLTEAGLVTPTGNTAFDLTAYYAATDAGATSGGNEFMLSFVDNAPTLALATTDGALAYSTTFKDGIGGVDGLGTGGYIAASPDGKNVYVTSASDNAVTVFNRDVTTGALTYVTLLKNGVAGVDGLRGANSLVVSADGKNVYVCGTGDSALVVFNRDTTTGALTYSAVLKNGVGGVAGLSLTSSVTVSPDGMSVYAASQDDNTLAVFSRNTTTGALTYSTVFTDGTGGVDGLSGASEVVVSADNKNVYVVGEYDNALAVFNRNTTTGALTYSTVFKDQGSGVDGLAGARRVAVSADGKSVYVTGFNENALAVFNRNTTTGALTYSTAFKDGVGGVDGLAGALSVTVSADGTYVYVAGLSDNALAVFDRDTTTGALTYSTVFKDGVNNVDGLNSALTVAVSADGNSVFVTSFGEGSLAVFNRNTGTTRTVTLADAANGLADAANATVTDTEGNWSGGTLTIERVTSGGTADGNANDVFSFLPGLTVTGGPIVRGSDATGTISDGTTQFATWAYTSATGKLVVTFDSGATTAQVQSLVRNIGYSNNTPYGDANIRLTLTDRVASNTATATVTVTSDTIYVDRADDTDSDGDGADGFTLREALARGVAQGGADTIKIALANNTSITLGSGVTSGAGDTLDFESGTGLTISGSTITLAGALTIANSTSGTATIASTLSGSAALSKTGDGRITLSGNNSALTGAVSVTGGTLAVGASAITNSSGLTLDGGTLANTAAASYSKAISLGSSGGTVDVSSGALTLSGAISGSGTLTVTSTNASNALTLSGTNTHTGGTTLQSGVLQFNTDGAAGTGTLTINGGKVRADAARTVSNALVLGGNVALSGSSAMTFTGTVDLGGATRTVDNATSSDLTFSGVISNGSLTVASNGAGKVILSGTNTISAASVTKGTLSVTNGDNLGSGTLTLNGGTLAVTGMGVTLSNAVTLGSSHGTISNANALTVSGVITGTGNLTKAGAGNLTLSGANTYSGTTTVSAGSLTVGHSNALGTTAGGTTLGASTTLIFTDGVTVAENVTLDGGWMSLASGSATLSGNLTLANANGARVTIDSTGSLIFSGSVTGAYSIYKFGAGTLTLSGDNSSSTTLIAVSAGTLSVGAASTMVGGALTLNNGGTLVVTGTDVTLANAITLGSGASTISNANALTLSGAISGAGNISKTGAGKLTLSGANTYTGTTTVTAGTLRVGGDGNLGTGALTLNGGGLEITTASATIDNAITIGASGATVSNAVAATLSGALSGNGLLTKAGDGSLTLSGSNSLTGATTLTGGTLSISTGSKIGTGTLTLNGGVLEVTGTATLSQAVSVGGSGGGVAVGTGVTATLSGAISGSGLLSKTGAGTLTLSGTQTATGGLSVTGGTVKISTAANMVGGTLTLDGGTLDVGDNNLTLSNALVIGSAGGTINVDTVNNNGLTLSGAVTGSGTLSKTGTDVVYFANASSFTGALDVQAGSIVATGSSTFGSGQITLATGTNLGVAGSTRSIANNIVLAGNAALYTGQPTDTSNGETITFSGVVSGAGNLTIIGATSPAGNLVVLSGINTYTGTTTLSTGRLSVASDANLGSGALSLAADTTLVISAATTIDNAVTLAGNATVKTDADATLSGALSGTGNLTKTGTSTLTLSGTQTGTGATHVRGGALSVGADGNLLSGTVTLNGGSLTLTGGNIGNAIDLFDNATITASADATLSGVITGAGVLTKAGAGTLTLSGTQTATGGLNVSAGTVSVAADANLLGGVITLAGGNLSITGATTIDNAIALSSDATITNSAAVTLSGVLSGTGTLTKAGAGTLTLSGTQTATGGLNVSAGTVSVAADANLLGGVITLAGGDLSITGATTIDNAIALSSDATITNSAAVTLSGVLSGTGTLSKAGSSTLTLTGTQTGTGGLVIAAGTLAVAGDANLLGGTITLSGGTLLITGAATIDNALAISTGALNTSGAVTLSGVLSGSGDLSKTGSGTLTLTGTSSAYTNTLTLSDGALVMNGVLGGSVVLTSGTSLSGSGSIGGSVVAEDGSTVTAGNSPGRLSIGGDLQIDGTLLLELDGTTAGTLYDQLAVTGTVTLNGGTLSLTTSNSFVPVAGDSFTIIDNDGTDGVVGTFGSLAEGASVIINGVVGSISYTGGSGNDVVLRANSLPTLDVSQSPSLAGVDEDAPAPSNGSTDGSVLVTGLTGGISDIDPSNSLGIAITGVSSQGTLYYSVDGGTSWTAVSSVSESAALLLPADANTRLYFKPNAGVNGPITDAVTFKGWDGTVGTAGSTADTTSGSAFSTASDTASITIAPVNDAPEVGGLGSVTHTEAGGAVLIAATGTLSDVDSNTLSRLTITLAATPDGAAESLGVLGSLPTGITAGNYDASTRSLTLSGVASLADYQTALRQITYANSDQDPDTSARSISIVAHDGAADSTAGTLSVTVVAVNDAPVLSGGGGSVQATVRDQAYSIGGGLSFSDADNSSFDGGVLTVSITAGGAAAQDVLGVANIGLITVSGNTVSFDGTAIGTLAGGSGGVALSITLNANAGTTAVTALLNAITYTNASSGGALSADDRTVSFALNDGAGGTSSALTTTVQVNQPPSLPVNSGLTVAEGGVLTLTGSMLAAADNEGSTAAQLTYSLTTAPSLGTLFRDANNNGSLDSGEALAVGGQFTQAEINAGSIKLQHDGSETLSDSFTLSVTDKDGLTLSGQTVAVSITGTNDAPTLTGGSLSVTGTDEDTTSTAVTVASIVAQLGFSDADGNEGGLAIFGSSGNGGWEYSLDGGTSFIALGSVSADAALLLGPTALLRYVPDGRNAESAGLSLRGWDQSVGTAGSTVAANTVGGSSALSAGSASLSLSVTAVNDAPVLTPASPSFDSVGEDETSNAGQTVARLLGSSVTDPDSDASQGLALTGLSSSTGTWQYSLDGGSNWSDVGAVSADAALLLRATDRIRFVPDGQNATSASITYTAWDQSSGSAGNKVTASGGAFSTASDTASISVSASNDAPEAVADSAATDEATVLTVAAGQGLLANDTDIDSGDSSVVSAVNGSTVDVGQTITLTSGALLQVNEDGSYSYDPNGAFSGLGGGQQATDSFTYTITDSEGATSTATVTLTITGVNDAPAAEDAKSVVIARNAGATGLSIEAPTDPDGDVVTVTITTLPGNGSLSKADGSAVELGSVLTALDLSGLRFDPDDGFVGEAGELIYTVSDGTSSVSRAVSITIAEEQMVSIAVKDGTGSTQAEPGTGEGNRTYTFVISRTAGLDAATEGSITVSWVIEEGGGIDRFDFAGAVLPAGSITFAEGESSKEITIAVAADGSIEGDETFTVKLTGLAAVGLTLEPRVNDPDSASATILDAETDRVQPKVTGVIAPDAKTYFPGDVISFDLVFSEVVQVGSTTPTVELMIGDQTVLATYASGSGSNTLRFTYMVLANQTDADGISIANQLTTANAALITDSAGNSATASYRLTAPTGTALDLSGVLVNVVSGKSIDGYITGATVYADADRDGVQDSGEISSITDAAGNYTISGGDGPYIMVGGTDISTGHVFDGVYEAPPRATVINPLTTAIVGVAGLSASDAEFSAAADKVKSALGLASSIDLYTYDPILAATATGASATDVANALKAQGEAAKIANLIVQGSAVLKGAATVTLDNGVAGQAIADALGAAITALPSGGTINLSDAATIEAIIRDAASRLGTVDASKVGNVAADAATVVAAGSSSIDSAASSSGTGLAGLEAITKVQVVAQGDAATALQTGTSSGSVGTAVSSYTGTSLDTAVSAATVGTLVPSRISIGVLDAAKSEGDSGTTAFTFQVTRSGGSSGVASVAYQVSGANGLNAADFGGTLPSGTVTFADGETSKTLTILVSGDVTVEGDESFTVTLSNPSTGADIGTAVASGLIIDNDPVATLNVIPTLPAVLAGQTTAITGFDVLDGDSATLTVTLTATNGSLLFVGPATQTAVNGGVRLTGSVEDIANTLNTLRFTAKSGATSASIRMVSTDGTNTDDDTVSLRIASSPVNVLPVRPTVVGGRATEIIGIGVMDTDSSNLTVTLTPGNGAITFTRFGSVAVTTLANGVQQLSGSKADVAASLATVTFTAATGVTTATLRIATDDGDATTPNDSDLITIDVVQPTINTVPSSAVVLAGSASAVTGLSVSDIDSTNLSVTLTPTNGTVAVTLAGSATLTQVSATVIRINGTAGDINSTLASLRFTAQTGVTSASLRMVSSDDDSRTPDTTSTIPLTVRSSSVVTLPGALSPVAPGGVVNLGALSVSDTDSASLTVTLTPTGGTLALTGTNGVTVNQVNGVYTLTGSPTAISQTLASLSLTAGSGVVESTVRVQISDGDAVTPDIDQTLRVSVYSAPILSAPSTQAVSSSATTALTGISVSDVDSASLSVTITPTDGTLTATAKGSASISQSGGVYTLTGSPADVNATLATLAFTTNVGATSASVTVSVSDGDARTTDPSQTISLAVVGSEPPSAGGDVVVTAPNGAAVSIVEDSSTAAANIRISPTTLADDGGIPPISIRIVSVTGGTLLDANGNAITFGVGGTLLTLDNGGVDLRFTPDANRASAASVQYVVVDPTFTGLNSPASTATITMTPVNDAPVAGNHSGAPVNDTALSVAASVGLLSTASDIDGTDALVVSAVNGTAAAVGQTITLPSGASLRVNADGSYVYTPGGAAYRALGVGQTGSDSFTYTVSDGAGGTSTATVTLALTGVNDTPTVGGSTAAVGQGSTVGISQASLLAQAADVDSGDSLSLSAVNGIELAAGQTLTLPSGATLFRDANGNFTYNPNGAFQSLGEGQTTTDSFTYTVRDASGATSTATMVVTVTGSNDAPVATGVELSLASQPAQAGAQYSAQLPDGLFSDIDAGDSVSLSLSGLPQGYSFDAATRTISGVGTAQSVGRSILTLTATDRLGATVSRTVELVVREAATAPLPAPTPVNDNPVGNRLTVIDTSIAPVLVVAPSVDGANLSSGAIVTGVIGQSSTAQIGAGPMDATRLAFTEPAPLSQDRGGFVAVMAANGGDGGALYLRLGVAEPRGRLSYDAARNVSVFSLPDSTFVTNDRGVSVEARLPDGKPLPAWLKFDARSGTFTVAGRPPADVKVMAIEVRAVGGDGRVATAILNLNMDPAEVPSREQADGAATPGQQGAVDAKATSKVAIGKAPVSQSIRMASSLALQDARQGLLDDLAGLFNDLLGTAPQPQTAEAPASTNQKAA
jgi:autotransporter-associated beta strand protein